MESNLKSGMRFFLFPEPEKGYFEEQKTVDFDGNVCFLLFLVYKRMPVDVFPLMCQHILLRSDRY